MANAAIRRLLDMVLFHESASHSRVILRFPMQVEHLFTRPHETLRFTVTIKAELHVQALRLPHKGHLVYLAVAAHAANSLTHMNAMIEIDEVGDVMNAVPVEGLAGFEALPDGFEYGAVLKKDGMAVHTGLGRWNPCKR